MTEICFLERILWPFPRMIDRPYIQRPEQGRTEHSGAMTDMKTTEPVRGGRSLQPISPILKLHSCGGETLYLPWAEGL